MAILSELNNSLKAKLYDFTYTPFMSSVFISWILLNHKYLLIYFTEIKINEKLLLLNNYDFSFSIVNFNLPYAMNFIFPVIFGLFYVFAYPKISKFFYKYTLNQLKYLKKIKQDIHDKTPILQEDAKLLYSELERLSKERDEAIAKVATMEAKYKVEITDISPELEKYEQLLNKDKIKIDPKTTILEYLYESNYNSKTEDNLITAIISNTKLSRAKVLQIYKELLTEKILYNDGIRTIITDSGYKKLLELFES